MCSSNVIIGIVQRGFPIHDKTWEAITKISCKSIIIDATPRQIIQPTVNVSVFHEPDEKGFFAIALLKPLFTEFLLTQRQVLMLIEGDLVPTEENLRQAQSITTNTKIFYQEAEPDHPYAYIRREGLAGLLLRSEVERICEWMWTQPFNIVVCNDHSADINGLTNPSENTCFALLKGSFNTINRNPGAKFSEAYIASLGKSVISQDEVLLKIS